MTTVEESRLIGADALPYRREKALSAIHSMDKAELTNYINDAGATIEQQATRISELEQRLEVDPEHPYDGIACRNVTIRELEKVIDDRDRYIRKLEHNAVIYKKAAGMVISNALDAGLIEGAAAAQAELDRLDGISERLQRIVTSAYQMAGLVGAPVRFLDALANPCDATEDQINALLPIGEDEIDAKRENGLLKQLIARVIEIPRMTDEDLTLLKSNCLAVIKGIEPSQ